MKFAEGSTEPAYAAGPDTDGPTLVKLMRFTEEEFGTRFSGSPVKRAKRRGFLRNVAVALGNWGSKDAVPALITALYDEEPLIRGHAAWALGRVGLPAALDALSSRLGDELDPVVLAEIDLALGG